jgi:glycolate oxidase iron-sulfur subunit
MFEHKELYPPEAAESHLGVILTGQGDRSLYDSVCQCNRCGYCEQACPTYRIAGLEGENGRGRNQLIRMAMTRRLKPEDNRREVQALLKNCLLCGACENVCYTAVKTPLHVWEGLRSFGIERFPSGIKSFFKKLSLDRYSARTSVLFCNTLRVLGAMPGVGKIFRPEMAGMLMGRPRFKFLNSYLRENRLLKEAEGKTPACVYFPSCGEEYLYPEAATAAIYLLDTLAGPVKVLDGLCCGFYSFMSGDAETARLALSRVIDRYYELCGDDLKPLVCSCSDCAGFLRSAEQLFSGEDVMRSRAARFARHVQEVSEFISSDLLGQNIRDRAAAAQDGGAGVKIAGSSIAMHYAAGIGKFPAASAALENILRRTFGDAYRAVPEPAMPDGSYGAYPYVNSGFATRLLKRKVGNMASVQTALAVTSSAAETGWLAGGFKNYYPSAHAVHYCVLLKAVIEGNKNVQCF